MSPMFVPDPLDVAPEVLDAQTRPWMPQRSNDFEAIFQGTDQKLIQLFFTH
jgi:aspartate aminotransferase-like enzyme